MTSKEYIQAEADNINCIYIYREGLFWKAYEHSAFILCTQIRSFKPTKRALKVLDGKEIVSIGFPAQIQDSVLKGLEVLSTAPDFQVMRAPSTIEVADFEEWKVSLPLKSPLHSEAAGSGHNNRTVSNREEEVSVQIVKSLRNFDLVSKTPLECMLFISEMKKVINDSI